MTSFLLTHSRCIRLKTSCTPSQITRKRATKTVSNARLEEKVDGILSLLNSKTTSHNERRPGLQDFGLQEPALPLKDNSAHDTALEPSDPASAALNNNIRNFANFTFIAQKSSDGIATPQTLRDTSDTSQHVSPFSSSNGCYNTPSSTFNFNLSPSEAEHQLQYFRTQILPGFAVIHLEPHTTAASLQRNRPFLFLAIMMVSSPPVSLQRRRMSQEIKEQVARSILSEKEGDIDVLLGLLIFLTW